METRLITSSKDFELVLLTTGDAAEAGRPAKKKRKIIGNQYPLLSSNSTRNDNKINTNNNNLCTTLDSKYLLGATKQ